MFGNFSQFATDTQTTPRPEGPGHLKARGLRASSLPQLPSKRCRHDMLGHAILDSLAMDSMHDLEDISIYDFDKVFMLLRIKTLFLDQDSISASICIVYHVFV